MTGMSAVFAPRKTRYRNIVHTLNHVYVIDSVFKAHLLGREHGHSARNTPDHPPLADLWQAVRELDNWYVEHTSTLSAPEFDRSISFRFIGGGTGVMTCGEMLLHVVNHGTYHRGQIAAKVRELGGKPVSTDYIYYTRTKN